MEPDLTRNYFRVPTHPNRYMNETTNSCTINVLNIGKSIIAAGIDFESIKHLIGSVYLDMDFGDLITLPGDSNFINTYLKFYEACNVPIWSETKSSDFNIVLLIEGYYGMNYLVVGMLPISLDYIHSAIMTFRAKSIINSIEVDTLANKYNV